MNDLLMWIGYNSFPSIEAFVDEYKEDEVYKRVGRIPKEFEPGKTRIFLAHDEGVEGNAVIIGYFIADHIKLLMHRQNMTKAKLKDPNIKVTSIEEELLSKAQRGNNYRDEEGAMYLCSKPGDFHLFEQFRDYNKIIEAKGMRFRSFMKVDGEAIITSEFTKPAPSKAGTPPSIVSEAKPESDWTEVEYQTLVDLVSKLGSPIKAFKEMTRITSRSIRAVEFQWYSKVKKDLAKYTRPTPEPEPVQELPVPVPEKKKVGRPKKEAVK